MRKKNQDGLVPSNGDAHKRLKLRRLTLRILTAQETGAAFGGDVIPDTGEPVTWSCHSNKCP